jgi:hypothetical protein
MVVKISFIACLFEAIINLTLTHRPQLSKDVAYNKSITTSEVQHSVQA